MRNMQCYFYNICKYRINTDQLRTKILMDIFNLRNEYLSTDGSKHFDYKSFIR